MKRRGVGRGLQPTPHKKERVRRKERERPEKGRKKEKVKRRIKREKKELNQSFQEHVVIGLWKPPDHWQQTSDLLLKWRRNFAPGVSNPFRKILPAALAYQCWVIYAHLVNILFSYMKPCQNIAWFKMATNSIWLPIKNTSLKNRYI